MAYSYGAAPVDMTDSAYLAGFTTTMTALPYKWVPRVATALRLKLSIILWPTDSACFPPSQQSLL